jgi:hypothetical protein
VGWSGNDQRTCDYLRTGDYVRSEATLWAFLASCGHDLCAHDDLLTRHHQRTDDDVCTQDHLCAEAEVWSV